MKPEKQNSDRLSELPDDVLVHILSYMPIVDAVRTMLIRPFRNLWTSVHTLNFEINDVLAALDRGDRWRSDDVSRFFIFVRNVLLRHKRDSIDEFRLDLHEASDYIIRSESVDDIRMCLRFALDKQAKVIDFSGGYVHESESSDYPNFISQSLVSLKLFSCAIYPELRVDLRSLKKLKMSHVTISEEAFQQFIFGCPSLQELHINSPFEIRNLSFSAPNIRKLLLVLDEEDPDSGPWLLNFPNLESLHLSLYGMPDIIDIDVSCVRDVCFTVSSLNKDDENQLRMFKLFLDKFSQSEVLRLALNAASEDFLHLLDDLHLSQVRWKRLVLPLPIRCQICVLGVYQLIRSSKDLEELDIHTHTILSSLSVCNSPNLFSGELSYPCVMPKLKTVTLHGYAKPWEHQLQLVEFLLKSATVLEKLVIVPNKCGLTVEGKLEFVMHVSSFQRSSPSARVLFL